MTGDYDSYRARRYYTKVFQLCDEDRLEAAIAQQGLLEAEVARLRGEARPRVSLAHQAAASAYRRAARRCVEALYAKRAKWNAMHEAEIELRRADLDDRNTAEAAQARAARAA